MIEINEGISVVSSVAQRPDRFNQSGSSTPLSNPKENRTFPDSVSLSSNDTGFAASQVRSDNLNVAATTIREANKIMDDVAKVVDQKREEILEYEKIYPPFLNEPSEKLERLKSIPAFQKQLDALTLIPNEKELAGAVTDQLSVSALKNSFFSEVEEFQIPQHEQEASDENNGLNIASNSVKATDSEVRQYGRELATIDQKLGNIRAGLEQDAKTISQEIVTEQSLGKSVLESEQEATQKSEEIKKVLATLPGESLGHEQGRTLLETLR